MQRIRRNCDVWIIKSLWEEDPRTWQTDLFFTEHEAMDMFIAAMKNALAIKYFNPSGDLTMDFYLTKEPSEDGQSKSVRTASVVLDARQGPGTPPDDIRDSEGGGVPEDEILPRGHAENGPGEAICGPTPFFEISEPVRSAEDDHEPKNATGDTDHG